MFGDEIFLRQFKNHLELAPSERQTVILEIEFDLLSIWQKSFHDIKSECLEISSCQFSMIVTCLIILKTSKKMLIKLSEEL